MGGIVDIRRRGGRRGGQSGRVWGGQLIRIHIWIL